MIYFTWDGKMFSVPVGLHSPYIADPHSKSDASYIERKVVSWFYDLYFDEV